MSTFLSTVVPGSLHVLNNFFFPASLQGREYYYSFYFSDEETKAQKDSIT